MNYKHILTSENKSRGELEVRHLSDPARQFYNDYPVEVYMISEGRFWIKDTTDGKVWEVNNRNNLDRLFTDAYYEIMGGEEDDD